MVREDCLVFEGRQGPLLGILGLPTEPRAAVLIVVGQPQTRHGSHRMFTRLCRLLSGNAVATLRFDCGGWGDSPGQPLAFEQSAPDVVAAARVLRDAVPSGMPLVLVGLCDGASAAVLALSELKAAGLQPAALCLINPWVRSEATLNEALLKTWYLRRFADPAFWRQVFSGGLSLQSMRDFGLTLYRQLRSRLVRSSANRPAADSIASGHASLPDLMLNQLSGYNGRIWSVLSGKDLTAGELESLMQRDPRWRAVLNKPDAIFRVPAADHTFSDPHDWHKAGQWLAERALTLTQRRANK